MRLVALSVGLPREIEAHGGRVLTSIFKTPTDRRLRVTTRNIEGDAQADLTVHGGIHKAVYAYPSEHYEFWRGEFPGMDLPWGYFGENLTTEGLLEGVRIGDRFRIGTAEFAVTQPRLPCYKLGLRFDRTDIIKRFLRSGRTGFYLAVTREGEVGAGDAIEPLEQVAGGLTVADVLGLHTGRDRDPERLRRASETPGLTPSWREGFRDKLREADA